jgi:hypothetical protein
MNLTIKQIEIMKVVVAGVGAATVDLDQLLERLPYKTTKESLQFSLRAIERHGLIDRSFAEHRRGRVRRLIRATELGKAVVGGTGRPAPGPGAAVAATEPIFTPEASTMPEPETASLPEEISANLPEPEILSLPELLFPEPVDVFEEELIE